MKVGKFLGILLASVLSFSAMTACSSKKPAARPADTKSQKAYTVKIVSAGPATTDACNAVAKAATAITQAKYNTTIDLVRLGYATFSQQINLMLSAGEKFDLMPSYSMSLATNANSGKILALDDLLKSDGADILSAVTKDEWKCVTIGGKIYSVPNGKEKGAGYGIVMRKDMLDSVSDALKAAGFDWSKVKTEADLEPLLLAVKKAYPDTYPLVSDKGTMGYMLGTVDTLGGDFGVLENCLNQKNTTVANLYDTDFYRTTVNTRYKFAKEGLIMPDASTSTTAAYTLMGAGKGFAYFTNTKPGIEGEWFRKVGKDCTVKEIVAPFSLTSSLVNQWYIPQTSAQPARAMQILDAMYSDPKLANLFINGVEGTHYVVDSQTNLLNYPSSVTAANTTYSSVAWLWPNELISTPWNTDGASLWKDTVSFNKEAAKNASVAKGFVWDNSAVLNQVTACNNVTAKYVNALNVGMLDPATAIPKMDAELKSAGLQTILSEKQKQLNQWLASQKK